MDTYTVLSFPDSVSDIRTNATLARSRVRCLALRRSAIISDNHAFPTPSLQITSRLNESIPKILPNLEDNVRHLLDRQRQLQEIKPKIEEVCVLH